MHIAGPRPGRGGPPSPRPATARSREVPSLSAYHAADARHDSRAATRPTDPRRRRRPQDRARSCAPISSARATASSPRTTGAMRSRRARDGRPALIVLDLMLPELDGFEASCVASGPTPTPPILMLSARSSLPSGSSASSVGADDYLPKPFSPAELVVRVKAILRRAARRPTRSTPARPRAGSCGRRPASSTRSATRSVAVGARPADPVEFRLLVTLVAADGRALTRDQLLDAVYGADEDEVARPHDRRPHRTAPRQARRRRRRAALRHDRARRRLSRRAGAGPGTRAGWVAGAASDRPRSPPGRGRRRSAVGSSVGSLGVGVWVVGGETFMRIMATYGETAEDASTMFSQSIGNVLVVALGSRSSRASCSRSSCRGRIAQPLAEVGAAARRVAGGDLAARVPRPPPDELASLADSFNQMAAELERASASGATSSRTRPTSCGRR